MGKSWSVHLFVQHTSIAPRIECWYIEGKVAHALNLEPNAINSVAYPFLSHSIEKWPVKNHKMEKFQHPQLHAAPLLQIRLFIIR